MRRLLLILLASALMATAVAAGEGRRASQSCLSPGETRELVSKHTVIRPIVALRTARSAAGGGQIVSAHLCRRDTGLVYQIAILRHDGRVVRLHVDAVSGKIARAR